MIGMGLNLPIIEQGVDYLLLSDYFSQGDALHQSKVFNFCQQVLSPQGIAYIAYLTQTGWQWRLQLRAMLQNAPDPIALIQQLNDFSNQRLRDAGAGSKSLSGAHLFAEDEFLQNLLKQPEQLTAFLTQDRYPVYFHDFFNGFKHA